MDDGTENELDQLRDMVDHSFSQIEAQTKLININFSYPLCTKSLHIKIAQRFLSRKISNKFRGVLIGSFGIRLAQLKNTLK